MVTETHVQQTNQANQPADSHQVNFGSQRFAFPVDWGGFVDVLSSFIHIQMAISSP